MAYEEGSYFGDFQLFFSLKSNFTYSGASKETILYTIDKEYLGKLMKAYTSEANFMKIRSLRRYHFLKRVSIHFINITLDEESSQDMCFHKSCISTCP